MYSQLIEVGDGRAIGHASHRRLRPGCGPAPEPVRSESACLGRRVRHAVRVRAVRHAHEGMPGCTLHGRCRPGRGPVRWCTCQRAPAVRGAQGESAPRAPAPAMVPLVLACSSAEQPGAGPASVLTGDAQPPRRAAGQGRHWSPEPDLLPCAPVTARPCRGSGGCDGRHHAQCPRNTHSAHVVPRVSGHAWFGSRCRHWACADSTSQGPR